jgi:Flp pilus assembly pilin Flp
LETKKQVVFSCIDKHAIVRHYEFSTHGFLLPKQTIIRGGSMCAFMRRLWSEDAGQDIAEYAVMLAVILVLVVGTIRLIGSNANNAFSAVASSIQ